MLNFGNDDFIECLLMEIYLLLVILFVFTIGLIIFAYIQKQYDAGVK